MTEGNEDVPEIERFEDGARQPWATSGAGRASSTRQRRRSGSSWRASGEDSIAELCRRKDRRRLYDSWSKEFLEAGKKRLAGDTARQASSGEVKDLRREMRDLKEALAEQMLENRLLKKSMTGDGEKRMRYPASEKLEIIRLVERSTCRSAAPWISSAFRQRPFTDGTIATGPLARPVSRIVRAVPVGCGTGSRTMSAARLSTWPWTSLSCRPGSWP